MKNETEEIIIQHLKEGKTQAEISDILKAKAIKPNSLSHIEKTLKSVRERHGAKTMFHLGVILSKPDNNKWISVNSYLPINNSIVEAKNEDTGHIGKEIVFSDGVFNHQFTSHDSEEVISIEFKNVTHWKFATVLKK